MESIKALAEVFVADGPRPELAEQLSLFAPLMGSWALRVFEYEPDDRGRGGGMVGGENNRVVESSAEWHFGWALDGRAVADVWINPSRADRGPDADGEWGLSLRFYDPKIGAWRSTWHGPKRGWVIPFIARPTEDGAEGVGPRQGVGDAIVLSGQVDQVQHRWVFSELSADSFRWRREETGPDGVTTVRQRFEASRIKTTQS